MTDEQPKITTLRGGDPDKVREQQAREPTGMHSDYIVLTEEERRKGFVRSVRTAYRHLKCGATTYMGRALAETYARDPKFYGSTFCVRCNAHYPVGPDGEFVWEPDGSKVGA